MFSCVSSSSSSSLLTSLSIYRDSYTKRESDTASAKLKRQTAHAAAQSNDKKSAMLISINLPDALDQDVGNYEDKSVGGLTIQNRSGEASFIIFSKELMLRDGAFFKLDFYGVFDGHCDSGLWSQYVAKELPDKIHAALLNECDLNDELVTQAVTESIKNLEISHTAFGGTTVSCSLKIGEKVYVINVGDSRTILVKKERVYQLSEDANLVDERFLRAVHKMERVVIEDTAGTPRVGGIYALARDVGVSMLSSQPKFGFVELGDGVDRPGEGVLFYQKGDYLVLATDGFWDLVTNNEAADFINEMEAAGKTPAEMAALLTEGAANTWHTLFGKEGDDATVIVVKL